MRHNDTNQRKDETMEKKLEILHPEIETWVEVYRGTCERTIKAFSHRYAVEMGLRVRIQNV